ncbi:hypothetical protein LXL04_008721 [Taraxacum kok-saghyz]
MYLLLRTTLTCKCRIFKNSYCLYSNLAFETSRNCPGTRLLLFSLLNFFSFRSVPVSSSVSQKGFELSPVDSKTRAQPLLFRTSLPTFTSLLFHLEVSQTWFFALIEYGMGYDFILEQSTFYTAFWSMNSNQVSGNLLKDLVSSLHIAFSSESEWNALKGKGFLQRTGMQYHWKNRNHKK